MVGAATREAEMVDDENGQQPMPPVSEGLTNPRTSGSATTSRRRVPGWLKWTAPCVLLIQVVLVTAGVLDVRSAVSIAVVLEALTALIAVVLAVTAGSEYRQQRRAGASRPQAALAALDPVAPGPMIALLRHELGIFSSFLYAVRRRRDVPAGAQAFSYGREQRPMVVLMLILSVVELGVVSWLIPWRWLELLLLILGLYGLVWILGFQLSMYVRPHVLDAQRLRLRFAHIGEVWIPLKDVASVRKQLGSGHKKTISIDAERVAVSVMGSTNVAVHLRLGSNIVVNGRTHDDVKVASFMVDEPADAVRQLCQRIVSQG